MMEDYGLTQEELAAKLSKSQSSIANKLRILKLEDSVKNCCWSIILPNVTRAPC